MLLCLSLIPAMFLSILLLLSAVGLGVAYEPTWESLDTRELPQWYADAKVRIVCGRFHGCAASLFSPLSIDRDFPALGRLFRPFFWQ
jgi:hypothetical protein